MQKVTDETIQEFARAHGCTDVVITRPLAKDGSRKPYVKFICSCGNESGTRWSRFKNQGKCRLCGLKEKPKVSNERIIQRLTEIGCEFVHSGHETNELMKVYFICSCDRETTRIVECRTWDSIQRSEGCNKCTKNRRKQTCIKKYGVEVPMQNKDIQEKKEKINIERYGFKSPMQNENVREKAKDTNIERYGFINPLQNKDIQEKIKETNIERYGFKSPMQNENVREKAKETNIKKYGFECPLQNENIKEKKEKTNIERYGFINPLQNENVREKANETNIERYGFENPMQNEIIKTKAKETNIARYGFEHPLQNEIIKEKSKTSSLLIYGCEHPMQNSTVRNKQMASAYGNKDYIFPSGKKIQCQGYEPWAFDELLRRGVDENDILCEDEINKCNSIPAFWYVLDDKKHRYFPDICILSEKKIIEVKSDYTASVSPKILEAKMDCVLGAGFEIELWIFDGKKELTIW